MAGWNSEIFKPLIKHSSFPYGDEIYRKKSELLRKCVVDGGPICIGKNAVTHIIYE